MGRERRRGDADPATVDQETEQSRPCILQSSIQESSCTRRAQAPRLVADVLLTFTHGGNAAATASGRTGGCAGNGSPSRSQSMLRQGVALVAREDEGMRAPRLARPGQMYTVVYYSQRRERRVSGEWEAVCVCGYPTAGVRHRSLEPREHRSALMRGPTRRPHAHRLQSQQRAGPQGRGSSSLLGALYRRRQ